MAARVGARSRRRRSWAAVGMLLGSWLELVACGHVEPPPAAPAPVQRRASPQREDPEPQAPLELPDDVVLVGRWREPRALLSTLRDLSGRDLELELAAAVGTPRQRVDLGAPIELLARLDPDAPSAFTWAVSFGLEAATAERAGRGPVDVASPVGLSCAEASSLGSRSARVVCAASDAQLAGILPLATRALPLVALDPADVAFSLRTKALCARDNRQHDPVVAAWLAEALGVPSMNERFDAQFAAITTALTRELCDVGADLDRASIAFELEPHAAGISVSVSAPSVPRRSALAELVLGSGASGLAPTDFWYAHAESQDAGFIWGFDAAPIERWRRPIAELLGTALAFRGVPTALGVQARYLIESLPLPRGPVVHASGLLPQEARENAARRGSAWRLYVVRGSFAEYQYYAGELVKAWSDPILGPQFNRLIRAAWGPAAAPERLRRRRPAFSARLPRGAFTLEIGFGAPPAESVSGIDGADAAPPPAETLFVIVSPDEDGVKIACGADEKFLASLLWDPERIRASATLASRPGLGALNQERALAGGFVSLVALRELIAAFVPGRGIERETASRLARAPHRGASPIVYGLSQPTATSPLSLRIHFDRQSLEDLSFLLTSPAEPRIGSPSDVP